MHIPDGFLSAPVWGAFDVLAPPAVALAARRARGGLEERNVPLLGVMGAFVFAAQMINFPVGPGTSGHLLGGTLLAITLGPAAATVVMTAILAIQALVFQDGGILALGANVFNMAIAGVLAGYLPYQWLARAHRSAAIFLGGALSVLASGALALSELVVSRMSMPRRVIFLSLAVFLAGAIVEGAITLAAIRVMERVNPKSVRAPQRSVASAIALLAVVIAVAGILVASTSPDAIEQIAVQHSPSWLHAPLADYRVHGIESLWLRRALAGVAGLTLIYGACLLAGRLLSRRSA